MDVSASTFCEEAEGQHRGDPNIVQRIIAASDKIHLRALLARMLLYPVPRYVFPQMRSAVLRAVGFEIGVGTGFLGMPNFSGPGDIYKRLKIGNSCWFNAGCSFELHQIVRIGHVVNVGHEVMITTGTHEVGDEISRAGKFAALPVTIGDGVWLGARCIILPGVTIGKGSVISAGTVVSRDVPPNTIMFGDKGMPIEKWMALTKQGVRADQAGPQRQVSGGTAARA